MLWMHAFLDGVHAYYCDSPSIHFSFSWPRMHVHETYFTHFVSTYFDVYSSTLYSFWQYLLVNTHWRKIRNILWFGYNISRFPGCVKVKKVKNIIPRWKSIEVYSRLHRSTYSLVLCYLTVSLFFLGFHFSFKLGLENYTNSRTVILSNKERKNNAARKNCSSATTVYWSLLLT